MELSNTVLCENCPEERSGSIFLFVYVVCRVVVFRLVFFSLFHLYFPRLGHTFKILKIQFVRN